MIIMPVVVIITAMMLLGITTLGQISMRIFTMQIIIINQRKGIYMPIHINYVDEQDIQQIEQFMKPYFEKILSTIYLE